MKVAASNTVSVLPFVVVSKDRIILVMLAVMGFLLLALCCSCGCLLWLWREPRQIEAAGSTKKETDEKKKEARHDQTQSQCTYTRWRSAPRFVWLDTSSISQDGLWSEGRA